MDPELTGRNYDTLTHLWQAPHLQSNGIVQVERAIRFAKARGPALDIGCGGDGRFIDLLIRHGFAPEGVDVSARMIALARQRHPAIPFHEVDFSRWELPRSYDFILAWDSLWHLPLDRQDPVLEKICAGLNPGGIYVFTTGGVDGPLEKSDAFMGPQMEYSTLGIPRTLELLDRYDCICRHLEYDQYPEEHLYVIAQKR